MASTQDDSFREIQLSGKQLVFLFMAVIVILVGVFLMGLQVGRGVLLARGAPGADANGRRQRRRAATAASIGERRVVPSPATAGEKLSYAERLRSARAGEGTVEGRTGGDAHRSRRTPKAETPAPEPAPAPPAKPARHSRAGEARRDRPRPTPAPRRSARSPDRQ